MEYYSAIKKNGILPFATTWMNIEGVMLSEIEKDKYWRISLICGTLKKNNSNNKKNKLKDTENRLVVARGRV